MKLIGERIVNSYLKLLNPVARILIYSRISPNLITISGLILTLVAAYYFRRGGFLAGGLLMALAGTFDTLDGRVARETGRISKFGAFFDSTIDRYSDVLVFLGLLLFFNRPYIDILIILAITGSLMTSYARARAEGLGYSCKVGIMQRPERVTYIAAASVFDGIFGGAISKAVNIDHALVIGAILFVAVMSNITVLQRVIHVRRLISEAK